MWDGETNFPDPFPHPADIWSPGSPLVSAQPVLPGEPLLQPSENHRDNSSHTFPSSIPKPKSGAEGHSAP